jgi:transcription termination factor NusB
VQNAREVALNILYKIEVGEAYSNLVLDKELNSSDLSKLDKALASEIVYGVLTWKLTLDEIVKRYSSIRLKKISPWILNILRMGIYQIVFYASGINRVTQNPPSFEGISSPFIFAMSMLAMYRPSPLPSSALILSDLPR